MTIAAHLINPVNTVQSAENLQVTISANPLDLPAATFQEGLDRRKQNRAALMLWVRDALIEGTDFGKIHVVHKSKCAAGKDCKNPAHFSKPSLFKPGAEKICGMLGVTVRYPTLKDYEQAALEGVNLSLIIIRCEILDVTNRVVSDGVGARLIAQDHGDLNKALKMAEKSAHIDTTLRMAGLSEVFTQDIEDIIQRRDAASIQDGASSLIPGFQGISKAQYQQLEARIKELGLDRERVKTWMIKASRYRFGSFLEIDAAFYQLLFSKLDQFAGVSHEH